MRYDIPELRDRLAGEYVLGTMPSRARRRFERVMREHAALSVLVAAWEARLAPLDEATAAVAPPARVWRAVERRIAAAMPQRAAPRPWLGGLALWRGLAASAAAVCIALVLYLVLAPAPPAPTVVAVLADDSGQPSWVALMRPGREVGISAIRKLAGNAGHSFQLWGIAGGSPRPLGLLPAEPGRNLLISAANLPPAGGALAVSREPPGGSPTGLPTGPVLYQGKVLAPP